MVVSKSIAFGHLLHKFISASLLHYSHKTRLPKRIPFSLIIHRKASTTTLYPSVETVKAIRLHKFGGPEVLKWENVELGELHYGDIRVKNIAIGVNFFDVLFRKGKYKVSGMPFIPGMEAAGTVTAVGPGVTCWKVGDYVAYDGTSMGAYAEEQTLTADEVVPVPPSINPTVAASILLKGLTAHYLLYRYTKVRRGCTVLIHGATSGIGSLVCQLANAKGARIIGTVPTTEKVYQARENGCHHVIATKTKDFVKCVNEITLGQGVSFLFDFVGKRDTFERSLACLVNRGRMVSFGGVPETVPLSALGSKYLSLTSISSMQYPTRDALHKAAGEVLKNVELGKLKVHVDCVYHLSRAARAHEALESRKISGSVVLMP